jgi:predicted TIM-barrel fold metal-dependent hydrolase
VSAPLRIDRRTLIAAGAAAFATGAFAPRALRAQTGNAGRIDVHNHLIPPAYLAAGRTQIVAGADTDPTRVVSWSPDAALDEMDRSGVATAMLSISTPSVASVANGNRDLARRLTRTCNEYAASLVRDRPARFGSFAAVPLPDVEGAIAEAAYALDTLHADGIGLYTSYGDRYPGDPAFAPFFAELNRRGAVAFVHPASPGCCATSLGALPASLDEFMFEVTRAITSMIFGGTFAQFPNVRFIFTHAGGTTMPISGRIAAFGARHHEFDADDPKGVLAILKSLHYDIANSTNPSAMAALLNLIPTDRILFGSDTPYVPIAVTATGFERLTLADDVRYAIARGNALTLFPRLA